MSGWRVGLRRLCYLTGIVAFLPACHASQARTADGADQEATSSEIRKLKQEYAALELRLQDVEAERDRLRERAEAAAPSAEELARKPDADQQGTDVASRASPGGLPVVKLLPVAASEPEPQAEQGGEQARPVIRVHGEEPGTVTSGDIDDEKLPPKKGSPRRTGSQTGIANGASIRPAGGSVSPLSAQPTIGPATPPAERHLP